MFQKEAWPGRAVTKAQLHAHYTEITELKQTLKRKTAAYDEASKKFSERDETAKRAKIEAETPALPTPATATATAASAGVSATPNADAPPAWATAMVNSFNASLSEMKVGLAEVRALATSKKGGRDNSLLSRLQDLQQRKAEHKSVLSAIQQQSINAAQVPSTVPLVATWSPATGLQRKEKTSVKPKPKSRVKKAPQQPQEPDEEDEDEGENVEVENKEASTVEMVLKGDKKLLACPDLTSAQELREGRHLCKFFGSSVGWSRGVITQCPLKPPRKLSNVEIHWLDDDDEDDRHDHMLLAQEYMFANSKLVPGTWFFGL
jgi:hypothetical protein